MIGAVGASTNLYTPKSKSKASVPMGRTEAMKGTCGADTKKQIEALKKEIADRLNEMNIADKVSELKVHMSDAYLEVCLKDPQTLEDAMKSLEEFFNTPVDKDHAENRGYSFLVIGDKTQTISCADFREENFKNTGMYWQKDFTTSTAKDMKALEDAAAENMKKMVKKLSEDLMYRNLKIWANDESLN